MTGDGQRRRVVTRSLAHGFREDMGAQTSPFGILIASICSCGRPISIQAVIRNHPLFADIIQICRDGLLTPEGVVCIG
jgi:hypothetical protein